jgi:glutathione peroxidase
MERLFFTLCSSLVACLMCAAAKAQTTATDPAVVGARSGPGQCAPWLKHQIGKLHSDQILDLCALTAGKAVLLVNTASFCGYTPQFKGLEALYQARKEQGLTIIGFPSDDFFQEADAEAETADVCYINYGVTFPMTVAIKVRGRNAHPVFRHLHEASQPTWNFNKYLVDRDGVIVEHFGSNTAPDSAALNAAIARVLAVPGR